MFDDMKTKGALKKIEEGGTAQLSRSMIVVGLVNLRAAFKPLKPEELKKMPDADKKRANAIIDWYKDVREDKTKETYDKAKLDEVSKELLAQFEALQGPTEEEIADQEAVAKAIAEDEDIKQAQDIDIDNFFDGPAETEDTEE